MAPTLLLLALAPSFFPRHPTRAKLLQKQNLLRELISHLLSLQVANWKRLRFKLVCALSFGALPCLAPCCVEEFRIVIWQLARMKKHASPSLLVCLLLCVLSQQARAGSMDKDLSDLLHQGDLGNAVPGLENEGVTSIERLLVLTDNDVDAMVQKQLPVEAGRLLKQTIASIQTGWVSLLSGLLSLQSEK